MLLADIQRAAKVIVEDGTEGFHTASSIVGRDMAVAMLAVHIRHMLNGTSWPEPRDTNANVELHLREAGIVID